MNILTIDTSEEDKEKTKKELEMLLDHAPSMFFFKDLENRYIRVNKAFADFMGLSKKEIEGKSAFNFYPKEQAENFWALDKEVIETRVTKKNFTEVVDVKNRTHWLQIEKAPYIDAHNNVIGIVCFATDITDNMHLAKALADSELRFRRLFEAAQDGILILDPVSGQINEVNQYLIDMLGYSHEELLKKKLWEVGAFVDIERSKQAFEETNKNGYVTYEDMPLVTKDGINIKVEFVSNLYTAGNQEVIQCNIRNITDRKNLEHAREDRRLLEDEKEKIDFMAEANHELRTPLAIIKGNIDFILRESRGQNNRFADVALKDMEEEVEHLSNILTDLALLTTSDSEVRNKVVNDTVDVDVLVNRIIKRCRIIALEKNITIKKKTTGVTIVGDEKYIEKLIINLVKNAIFYGIVNGWVMIEVLDKKNEVLIIVSDNGIGISQEEIPKVFRRFYRIDKSHNSDERHTGLGLAISKRVVEAHGGTISVASEGIGYGATFTVILPKKIK